MGLGNLKTYLYTNSDLLDATVDVNGARSVRVISIRDRSSRLWKSASARDQKFMVGFESVRSPVVAKKPDS